MKNKISWLRTGIQIIAFILINAGFFGIAAFATSPMLRNISLPIGACRYLEKSVSWCYLYNLQVGLTTGWETIYVFIVLPAIIFMLTVAILGRAWCGWVCPLGFAADLFIKLRKSFKLSHIQIPLAAKEFLDRIKYAGLFLTVLISISIGIPILGLTAFKSSYALPLCQVCPAKPLFILLQQGVGILPFSPLALLPILMLAIFIAGSLAIRRFWCRFCPIGALISLFNRISSLWLSKDVKKCTKCGICKRCCPVGVTKVYDEKVDVNVTARECIMCFRCVELCPEDRCLEVRFLNKKIISSKYRISIGG
ncbi:MAG: 4Fe-4S binding protein [Candidatus Thermoplasmatota archaeon]|nr:4Fe-4S binding protein [Candidatus Thermoplasmatota archaeon]